MVSPIVGDRMQRRSGKRTLRQHRAVLATALLLIGTSVFAQEPAAPQPSPQDSAAAVPDRFETAQLVWSTLIALDQANRTGNYSVLRDLGSPSFRDANTPARLADIFRQLRQADLGLGQTVRLVPIYDEMPPITEDGRLRLVGSFATRPVGINFDLMFEFVNGAWHIYEISIGPYQPMEPNATGPDGAAQAQ